MNPAVLVSDLAKSYGPTRALAGVDFAVAEGTVFGLLGPNGAGKTTAVRILATLLQPTSGHAEVQGLDVTRHPDEVRRLIGLAGQYAAVDELLTGRENLRLVGTLYHLPATEVRARADDLLARFELTDAADRPARTYSGGMRRRLDLAASLVNRPQVLFLDEPTTGLDPRSRSGLWAAIRTLVDEGTTLLLTTQYLEEADRLADRIAVIDHGAVIAEGTADQLKDRMGGQVLEVRVAELHDLPAAADALEQLGAGRPQRTGESGQLSVPATGGLAMVADAARALQARGIAVSDLGLRRPTLDDVFLSLTGHAPAETEPGSDAGSGGAGTGGRRRRGGPSSRRERSAA